MNDHFVDQREIKQLEEWTLLKYDEIIFDSDCCDWSSHSSTFDNVLFNRGNIVIIIEDSEGNRFGGFLKSTIETLVEYNEEYSSWEGETEDENVFLFSFYSNDRSFHPKKYPIHQEESSCAFQLFDSHNERLFSFGFETVMVMKKDSKRTSWIKNIDFNFDEEASHIFGKLQDKNSFTVNRFIVVQMK